MTEVDWPPSPVAMSSAALSSASAVPEGCPGSPPERWVLGLLHSFRVERDGLLVHRFQMRILDCLLAYLSLQPTRAHGREEIARLFWPDRPINVALRRLSHVLFILTRQLKDLGLPGGVIIADYYTLRLAPEIGTDIQRLDELISRALREPDRMERQRILDHVIELHGDGILPMMSQPWVKPERDRLAERLNSLRGSLKLEGSGGAHVGMGLADPTTSAVAEPRVDGHSGGRPPSTAIGDGRLTYPSALDEGDRSEGDRLAKAQALATWLERLEPHLLGSDRARWVQMVSEREVEIRMAAEWALSAGVTDRDPGLALRFVAALWRYWYLRSMVQHGRRHAEQVLLARPAESSPHYARAVYAAGSLALCSSDHAFAKAWFVESLQMAQRLGDERLQSRCLASLGVVAYQEADLTLARQLLAEGAVVFRAAGEQVLLAGALHNAALVEIDAADFERAEALLGEYMALGHRLGDQIIMANGLVTMGTLAAHTGSWEKMVPLVAQAQPLFETQGDLNGVALCLRYQSYIAAERGQTELARVYVECSLSLCRALNDPPGISESLHLLAEIFEKQGRMAEALALYRDALQQPKQAGPRISTGKTLREGVVAAGQALSIRTS